MGNQDRSRRHAGRARVALAKAGVVAAVSLALLVPAAAQFWTPWGQPPRPQQSIPQRQPQQQQQPYNPFGGFFEPQQRERRYQGPSQSQQREREAQTGL